MNMIVSFYNISGNVPVKKMRKLENVITCSLEPDTFIYYFNNYLLVEVLK